MVRCIKELHMDFLFAQPYYCKMSLVREFYANWDLRECNLEVKIRGQVLTFTPHTLNTLLGTPKLDVESLKK